MVSLSTPITSVAKISKKIIPALHRLGIKTIRDLLFHFPARYENFSEIMRIADIALHAIVTIQGTVEKIENRRTPRKKMMLTEAVIRDDSGCAKALWFQKPFLLRNMRAGTAVSLSGKVGLGPKGLYLQNPAYEKIENSEPGIKNTHPIHTAGLVPVYPETQGITSRWLRYLISSFLDARFSLREALPEETREKHALPHIREALRAVHFPSSREDAKKAEMRFAFEELLILQLRALQARSRLKSEKARPIPRDLSLIREFVRSLSYSLTDAQRRSMWEIFTDLERSCPMNRLLEGDVGSGKTVVAAGAILLTARAGYRAVLMAPTEILARQHYDTLSKLLAPFAVSVGIRIGAKKQLASAPVVVGTHALIQSNAQFENLGLVIVDEQHRFGVEQRSELAKNNRERFIPHFLSMSATPIPRTLALAVYGDLDLSALDEMPKTRKPVITKIVSPEKRNESYEFIRSLVKTGRQAFVVCPRIEIKESDADSRFSARFQQNFFYADTKAVKDEYEKLSQNIFPDLRVGMLHGKMKSKEKEKVMRSFASREIDILVSTSVIEVGVDIPNAAIMMIEGAERFGLAQVHQFRGRVGRGEEQSYCFLFPTEGGAVSRRLQAVVAAKNGFELAEKDLAIRGPGDLFGTRQSGIPDCALKHIANTHLIKQVRDEAREIVKQSPDLSRFPALLEKLKETEQKAHLE